MCLFLYLSAIFSNRFQFESTSVLLSFETENKVKYVIHINNLFKLKTKIVKKTTKKHRIKLRKM